jgi:hypothetical protein
MSVLNGTTPLFAFIIARLWLKLGSNFTQLLGIFIGMVGLFIFVGYDSFGFSLFALVLCLLASFFYAFSSNSLKSTKEIDATFLASTHGLVATFLVLN